MNTKIMDETETTLCRVVGQRAYELPINVAGELDRLLSENARLERLAYKLAEACQDFLEAQDSPAPRDLLTLAAIKASAALTQADQ